MSLCSPEGRLIRKQSVDVLLCSDIVRSMALCRVIEELTDRERQEWVDWVREGEGVRKRETVVIHSTPHITLSRGGIIGGD